MLLVFDENFSKKLAEGMDLLEKSNPASKIKVDVISAEKLMGRRGATDKEIIMSAKNGIIITKDKDFRQIKLYKKVIEDNKTKVLFIKPSKKMILFWDILIALISRWEEVKEKLSRDAPPYVFEFDIRKGVGELHF